MIDVIKRQNNIRKSIESTARLIELLDDLQLIKYTSFISINRISDKESSLIARESNRSRESINFQIKQQKQLYLLLSSIILRSISFFKNTRSIQSFLSSSSCLVSSKSISKLHSSLSKITTHSLKS